MKRLLCGVVLCLWFSTSLMAQGFAALIERLETVEQHLNQIETAPNPNAAGLEDLQRGIDSLRQRTDDLAELDRRFGALQQQVVQTSTAIDHLESGAREEGSDVRLLAVELGALMGELRGVIEQGVQPPAQIPTSLSALEISGFGDFCNVRSRHNGTAGRYQIGQVEVDLSAAVDPRLGVDMAIAYDEEGFGLGAFTTNFRLLGHGEDHFYTSQNIQSMGVVVGQFDVPFGIDWHVYPSIDRLLISAPLIVEGAHGAWNDYGVQGYVETRRTHWVAYLVNGADVGAAEMAAGGRFGLRAGEGVELGVSLAGFFDDRERLDSDLLGFDAEVTLGAFAAKGEYIYRRLEKQRDSRGFYAQGVWHFGRYFAVGRYGLLELGNEETKRISSGIGWRVIDACQVRLEYQVNSAAANSTVGQLVIGF